MSVITVSMVIVLAFAVSVFVFVAVDDWMRPSPDARVGGLDEPDRRAGASISAARPRRALAPPRD
jgi:hypothetical protein